MGSLIYLLSGTSVLTASIQPPSSPQSTLSPPSLFLARVRNLLFSSYATHSILVVVYTSEGRLLLQNISPLAKSRSQAYHNDVLHPTLLALSPQDRPAINRTRKIKNRSFTAKITVDIWYMSHGHRIVNIDRSQNL